MTLKKCDVLRDVSVSRRQRLVLFIFASGATIEAWLHLVAWMPYSSHD